MIRFEKLLLAAFVMVGFVVPLTVSSEAHAICDEPRVIYKFTNGRTTQRLSNLQGDWMEAGFAASYAKSTTAEVNASMTATVEAEAGIVFAKASASLGVTIGGSWSRSQTWTYTGPVVPRGKLGRVVMYHESRAFTVTKQSLRTPCKYVTVYSSGVDAPTRNGDNVWRMQYRNDLRGVRGAPPADDELGGQIEEFELGPDESGGNEDDGSGGIDEVPEEVTIVVPAALDDAMLAAVRFYSVLSGLGSALFA